MSSTSNFSNSQYNSVYVVNNPKMVKILQEHQNLNQFIVRRSDKENPYSIPNSYSYSINERKVTLTELEVSIEPIEFIERVRKEGFTEAKLVSSHYMRSICIRNISELCPLIDVYAALKNLTQEVKKIILIEDVNIPGLNQKVCIVEYTSHLDAKKSLAVLNNLNSSNSMNSARVSSVLSSTNKIEAVWCEPLVDNVKEILKETPFAYFENLLINNLNIFHFKKFLEEKSSCHIKRLRQFSSKLLVEFSHPVPQSLLNSKLIYEGKVIPVIPAMRPNLNTGKHKDKQVKASLHFLNDEDKKAILSEFAESGVSSNEGVLRKKAEVVYNKMVMEEKKEKKEKEKEKEDSMSINRKRERTKEDEYERERGKERNRDRDRESTRDYDSRDRRRDRKESEKSEESRINKSSSQQVNTTPTQNTLPTQNINPNILNLLLTNPSLLQNLSVLGNLQNLQSLQSLQSLIANPSLLTSLQQLISPVNTTPNAKINLGNLSNTSTSIPSSQSTLSTGTVNKNISTPIQTQLPIRESNITSRDKQNILNSTQNTNPTTPSIQSSNTNYTSSQINPMYNLPYQGNNFNQSKNFYPHLQPQPQYPYQMGGDLYPNINPLIHNSNILPNYQNLGNLNPNLGNLPPQYGMPQSDYSEMDMDPNMMKKYYEYLQSNMK